MIKEFTRKLLMMIFVVLVLLSICITVDYATNDTITNINNKTMEIDTSKYIMVNDSRGVYVNDSASVIVAKTSDKIYTEKPKHKTVTITSRPSCGCRYSYSWRTRTFISYCPHCHKYGTLRNVHKWPARHEQELTCDPKLGGCGADYCGVTGKEKYSWSQFYLRRA